MKPAPGHYAIIDAVVQAAVVAGWAGLTYVLGEVVFGSAISVDPTSPWTKLAVAAFAVFYPVWTILAIAMVAQTASGLFDRPHRS
jgi:hypothetical protein